MDGLAPGTLFGGRYEVIRLIGEGGMGAVYLACDPNDRGFQVALKVLFPAATSNPSAYKRFLGEMQMIQSINHENVVRSYEHFDWLNYKGYAMEYIDGGDLGMKMRDHLLTVKDCIGFMKQAARGLEAIHQAGIVHRDLKPENLLLTRQVVIKISDLGLALADHSSTLTSLGALVGTPQYLAPEYIELGEADRRSDIFALGVIAYEMIAGESPWGAGPGISQLAARAHCKVLPLSRAAKNCPLRLGEIVEKAISINLSQRHQDARELLRELEEL